MSTVRADLRRAWRRSSRYRPATTTGWIVVLTVAAYLVQLLTRGALEQALSYRAVYSLPGSGAPFEPWRMLTTALIHQPVGGGASLLGITHLAFNMYALAVFGRPLEDVLGGRRLLVVYLLSVLAGSVAVLYAAFIGLIGGTTEVYGASGGVFGVLGAVLAVQRRLRIDARALLVLIGINFAIPFVVGNIAWQAHLGGLVAGVAVGWLLVSNRGPRRAARGSAWAAGIAAVLLLLALVPAVVVR